MATLQTRLDRLRGIDPYLIDLSLRENPVGSRLGQTLDEKLAWLPRLRAFGFERILLGTLDYSYPEFLEVDDDFMMRLRDTRADLTGCFAFTDIGIQPVSGPFAPSASMQKLQAYRVPNTLHEIYTSEAGMRAAGYDVATLQRSLPASIAWLRQNVGAGELFINIVDGCDGFATNLEQTCAILELLATQPVTGLSFEDDRGTYLPAQVGAYAAIAREYLPPPHKLLVHVHAGAGFENAAVIEALMEGADGVWGGLPKRAAIIGHASLGELIANLVRLGNPSMQKYRVDQLLPTATALQLLDEQQPVPDDLPILGANAYRLTLDFFRQLPGRFMDLPPEQIGGTYHYRVCPVVSDPPVLAGRLAEVTGKPAETFPKPVLVNMIRLMRQSLRDGWRIAWDEPDALLALYRTAGGTP